MSAPQTGCTQGWRVSAPNTRLACGFTGPKRASPITLNDEVRVSLLERHKGEHHAGHLYDRVAERLRHEGYAGLAQHFRAAAAEERGPYAQRVEDILHALDIDPPHSQVQEPDLTAHETVLDLVYLAWLNEAGLARRCEKTKALAAEKAELAVEAMVDGILEAQLHEVEEARALYRRCESANNDGMGIMSVDGHLLGSSLLANRRRFQIVIGHPRHGPWQTGRKPLTSRILLFRRSGCPCEPHRWDPVDRGGRGRAPELDARNEN